MMTKYKIWVWHQIYHRIINHKKYWNVPLDTVMCSLEITSDIDPLLLIIHTINGHLSTNPSVKNYLIGHNMEID